MALSGLDLAIIVVYLFGITAFGIAKGFRRNASPTHYFLADKSLGWFTVGAALFTSNISTIHLLGLAAGGAKNGLTIGNFEWMAAFTLILLALVFVPFYVATGIRTLPEFMERRYCPQARTFLAVVGVVGALLIHIGMSLFAGAELFQSFLGIPAYVSIVILSALTVAYTAAGGLKAVVTTENIQVCLLLISSALVTVLGLCALPAARIHDLHSFVRALPPGQLQMLQPITDIHGRLNEYSWLGALLGYPILGIWYWCADQTHVQRVLGANSLEAAQKGALFAGFLKITPVFLMVLPGIISYVLWHQGAYRLPFIPGTHDFDFNAVLPALINYVVPTGLKGMVAAGMAAALMSCMAAAANGCSTIISIDIVKRHWPETSDKQVVSIGRASTVVVMMLAMLWSTQGGQFGTIFEAVNKIPMIFAPAVTTVFLFGVLWQRGTEKAAMATLYLGTLLGTVYFIVDLPSTGKALGLSATRDHFAGLVTDPIHGLGIPFMLVGPMLAAICALIYIGVTVFTPPPSREKVAGVCWEHPFAFINGQFDGKTDVSRMTIALILILCALYYLFG